MKAKRKTCKKERSKERKKTKWKKSAKVYEEAKEAEELKRSALERLKKEYSALKESLNKSESLLVEIKIALESNEDEVSEEKETKTRLSNSIEGK